ncbi:MAG TPA: bifunctional UDP-sugar hydrolase/5'-nucleotidase [Bacteroidales bacterium]|nr:bifunctional UDP-sugar hydrolase/5'-nucleotidase [Bacteroidales bacterium]
MTRTIRYYSLLAALLTLMVSCTALVKREVTLLETTDIHGVIMPYDYIEKEDLNASLASTFTYVRKIREEKEAVVLLDDGDNLQGQPAVYYYNFVDTVSPHLLSEAMNFMSYDGVTVGNHDVETGHSVYDRLRKEYGFPMLAANAIDVTTGDPYFKPFHIINKNGIRIAVLGLVTPTIHNTLPHELFAGIEFRNMFETAAKWMPKIKNEKPDLIVGLFHTGWDDSDSEYSSSDSKHEEGAAAIAYNIPGFDIIFTGHDHRVANEKIVNSAGDTVLILNAGSRSMNIVRADVTFQKDEMSGEYRKSLKGEVIKVSDYETDDEFMEKFADNHKAILAYVDEVIGNSSKTVTSRDSYFGSSGFVDIIHTLQLDITGADISFAAPLSFDVKISEGPVTVGDMFKLYRFENMLYTMTMTGTEVLKYLEYSYSLWYNTMNEPDRTLLKFRTDKTGKIVLNDGRAWLKNQAYNFDSAAGIDYTVDVSKPEGSRISISGMSNGEKFNVDRKYRVAVNSYRGNGGGGHFYDGVGIGKTELMSRVIKSTDRDLRFYMIDYIRQHKVIEPEPLNNWKVIPENLTGKAIERDYKLLFGVNR